MRRKACETRKVTLDAMKDEKGFEVSSVKAMDDFLSVAMLMRRQGRVSKSNIGLFVDTTLTRLHHLFTVHTTKNLWMSISTICGHVHGFFLVNVNHLPSKGCNCVAFELVDYASNTSSMETWLGIPPTFFTHCI